MLEVESSKRISALKALESDYFKKYQDYYIEYDNASTLPS